MTNWKLVQGSQAEKPSEWDTTSSASTVYQRRNVERVTVTYEDTTTELWQYEEREMTFNECVPLQLALQDELDAYIVNQELHIINLELGLEEQEEE